MNKIIMIKYGELTTKKANRKFFIETLTRNIERVLADYNVKITKDRVRMYIEFNERDLSGILDNLKKVFGLHGIVVASRVNNNIEEIESCVLDTLKESKDKTFKVDTKRADKNFPIHSMDFNNKIGGLILKNTSLLVDVHNPDLIVHIEIRPEGTFIYTNEIRGIGGYPVGIQGKGLLMLSGGIDSPVAGYLALKRGVDLECLYFDSPPHTSIEAKNKVIDLANIINEYSGHIKVNVVPFTKIQEEIYKNVPDSYIITIMRRMMYRIASRICQKNRLKVIINGESIGQVASQTLTSMVAINSVTNMPVIRPVACMDKLEIIDIAKEINTYETSILPYEDCCTIFLPKHPVINPDVEKCIKYESTFDYESLIEDAINNIEVITDLNTKSNNDFSELL
ncbi:MAG: tRNA 4-thiouridine(8) synthase ThiI [Bacilli bacterium]|nr:tRNA 4-thiouridine(8) synthase ThiI [Bacilli bacterium]